MLFWESWLNVMHTTKEVSEEQYVTEAYQLNLQVEASRCHFSELQYMRGILDP